MVLREIIVSEHVVVMLKLKLGMGTVNR